jgi:hypothetical protein
LTAGTTFSIFLFFVALACFMRAAIHRLTIRWMDRHGAWAERERALRSPK